MKKPSRNLDVEDMIIEHSMDLMIDVMEEIEADATLSFEDRTMLRAFTRVLRRRLVDYLSVVDGPDVWTVKLVEDCHRSFDGIDDDVRPIISAHCKFMNAVDALDDGDPIDGPTWRQTRRAFNHLVDSFRVCTDKPWPFLDTYSPKMNARALAS